MTDQEINSEIAQWHGARHQPRITDEDGATYRGAFDYLGDLNAMHRAEKKLDGEIVDTRSLYYDNLLLVAGSQAAWKAGDKFGLHWAILRATARQRAEALLRTLGRWKD